MPNPRLILALIAGLVLGGGGATLANSAAGSDRQEGFEAAHGYLTIDGAAAFPDFVLYSVGQSFEGLPLTGMARRIEARVAPDAHRANFASFRYGDCTPNGDGGCPAPLEIQLWPACERNLSSYSLTPFGDPLPRKRVTVRGVPGAFFESGRRLEVYTGSVSVVMFGQDKAQLLRAADALRAANKPHGPEPGQPLPEPAAGALTGRLRC